MGILDMLTSMLASKGASELETAVIPVVLSEVLGNGSQGGLSAIVAKLQQAGFGDQVKSWIGTGQNLPISAQQLQEVLGSDTVKQLAARFGIPRRSAFDGAGAGSADRRRSGESERRAPARRVRCFR